MKRVMFDQHCWCLPQKSGGDGQQYGGRQLKKDGSGGDRSRVTEVAKMEAPLKSSKNLF